MLPGHLLLTPLLLVDEVVDLLGVSMAVDRQAVRTHPGPDGTADLLIVRLDILRHVVVDHKAAIRFVDPHPEGNGGHDDRDVIPGKRLLILVATLLGESSVIGTDRIPLLLQIPVELIYLTPGEAVDDPGLVLPCMEVIEALLQRLILIHHSQKKVLPVKAGYEYL